MLEMTDRGAVPTRRRLSTSTARIAVPSVLLPIWRGSAASSRSTVTPDLSGSLPPAKIQLAACWAHARRKFYEVHQATGSPVAAEALRRIAELYAVEATVRGQAAEARKSVRHAKSLPLVSAMKMWLETQLNRVPPRGGVADAIRYALTRWTALCRFLDDGRIELDNNTVERAIRPIALGRKNHLFAGSDGGAARWATVASILATAKLNDVEPFAYLTEVLERLSNGHPMNRLDELLPWNWSKLSAAA
jgi:transposase